MKAFAGFLTILVSATLTLAAPAESAVVGFQAWKNTRVEEARSNLERLQQEKKSEVKKLQQAQLNVEVAKELTINDYFALYLSQFTSRESFVEAARKLTPEESADLMMSYQKHLSSSQEMDVVVPSASGLAPAAVSKQ